MHSESHEAGSQRRISKGVMLELRIARLMLAQSITPFLDVFFRSAQEASGVTAPDVDVMGCVVLPDATLLHSHVDCKSGESSVMNRVLLLQGLRRRMPPGPILYVRPNTKAELKNMALEEDIRIADIAEIVAREAQLVTPIFGNNFPSFSNPEITLAFTHIKGRARRTRLGRILYYLETDFWMEPPFTRLKRSIAAAALASAAATEAGLSAHEQGLVIGRILRQLVYALLQATFRVAYFSKSELVAAIGRWLVTEAIPFNEINSIVESTAQLIFETYGDQAKGPLKPQDYLVSPPDYTEELAHLLQRTALATLALPAILPLFDGEIIEGGMLNRAELGKRVITRYSSDQIESAKVWYRGLRLFLRSREHSLGEWKGWSTLD